MSENPALKEIIKVNINQTVKVKLTVEGIDELRRQHNELYSKTRSSNKPTFKIPEVDSEGYSKFQLHTLMHSFGHMLTIGFCQLPFETEILILEQ